MKFSSLLLAPLLASFTSASSYFDQADAPPQVAQAIDALTSEFQSYLHYDGPVQSLLSSLSRIMPHPYQPQPNDKCSYWLEDIKHQGIAAFNPNPSGYKVFRNVHDYGAKGDGSTDDTAAINRAISDGNRCGPGSCNSTTTTPAVVYFPPGTYMISSSIIDYYYTQLIGNPNCLPTIRATPRFRATESAGLIDGSPYQASGAPGFGATNIFWRQVRNFILDTTLIPASSNATGIHWPTGQATSIQNVVFQMSQASGTKHQGIFIEQGSGGFMEGLTFYGGLYGATFGNQQFTMRNFTFHNAVTAIYQNWDWGWTYSGITINNCSVGIDMSNVDGTGAQSVGSVTFIDSSIKDTPVGIKTAYSSNSAPPSGGSLILENVKLNNVKVAVQGAGNSILLPGTTGAATIQGYGQGHSYTPDGPKKFQGPITPNPRPAALLGADGSYYTRAKPQYEKVPVSGFISARDCGATGDGRTDDTAALQDAINKAVKAQKILFVDQGDYLVTKTIYLPAGSKVVGESYSVILSSGKFFNDINNPQPVVAVGKPGEVGAVEWSDMIVSTQGQQRGAILFQYNLESTSIPSGFWDVHARIGGFAGSDLQLANCPTTPKELVTTNNLDEKCIASFLTLHITKGSSGLYNENCWYWVADHDVEDPQLTQITIYAGRGLLDESSGPVWLVGGAVEHHTLYQYFFSDASNVYAGQVQTETAYYQPNPSAPLPFPYNQAYNDPKFATYKTTPGAPLSNQSIPNADGWGIIVERSSDLFFYGVGLYSFFNNYSTNCSSQTNGVGEVCQKQIFSVDSASQDISVYNLNTVGTNKMITLDGKDIAGYEDNLNGFIDTIALFRT